MNQVELLGAQPCEEEDVRCQGGLGQAQEATIPDIVRRPLGVLDVVGNAALLEGILEHPGVPHLFRPIILRRSGADGPG